MAVLRVGCPQLFETCLPDGAFALLNLHPNSQFRAVVGSDVSEAHRPPVGTGRELHLLGPVELVGVQTPRRSQILNVLTYLALHRRGVNRDALAAALWREPVSGKTLRNRVNEARRLVGGAITEGPNWRLTDAVTTDWERFSELAAGSSEDQHEALRLVRGRPFEGLDYADWIDLDGVRSHVEATVVDVALRLAARAMESGQPSVAYRAARAGLAASRYDERLHRLAIRAAEADGHTGLMHTLGIEMRATLGSDVDAHDLPRPQTHKLSA